MPAREMSLPRNRRPVPTRTRLTTRRLPVVAYVALLVLLPALVVGGAMATGWWSTAGHGGVTLTGSGSGDGAGSGSGSRGGEAGAKVAPADPADVKGSTSVRQVADAFAPITTAEILTAFGAPATTPDTAQLKTLVNEGGGGMDIPAFRTWLERRLPR
jgi:hypothetical protein